MARLGLGGDGPFRRNGHDSPSSGSHSLAVTLLMFTQPNRRQFLKAAALLPFAATFGSRVLASTSSAATSPAFRPVGGSKLKLSLNAFSFNQHLQNHLDGKQPGLSLLELLDFCAENNFEAIDATGYYFPGYPAVPSDAYINAFKRRAFRLGLNISGTGIRNDFATPNAGNRAADVQRAKAWIEVAAKLGAPVLRVFAGAVPKGYEEKWDEAAGWMIEALRECAEHGAKFGVLVGVQNHGDMLPDADRTIEVVKRVDSDWFGVIVDTGNMKTADPYADLARVVPYAVNWQVKESPRGNNSPELTDLPRLIRILKDAGYRGYLPIETLSATDKPYDPYTVVPAFADRVRAAMAAS
jgi:sugar phosphate isomerase/epimerase